jgi:phosphoglycolate phosphatase
MQQTKLELLNPITPSNIKIALFDFDGTLSLIRKGWQEIMIKFMTDTLSQLNTGETPEEIFSVVEDYVVRLTGKQTIYQAIQLSEEIKKRGGCPLDPLEYKKEYHNRLWNLIQDRVEGLRNGTEKPEDWLMPGSIDFLDELRDRGVKLFLASGTDAEYVIDEVNLLGLTPYFSEGIHGAQDDYHSFSKKMLIEELFTTYSLEGPDMVSFGDGYVEIEDTKKRGGIAVGIASNEESGYGINEWKRNRLIQADADCIIPNFISGKELLPILFPAK